MMYRTWMATVAYWVGLAFLFTLPMRADLWLLWLAVAMLVALVGAIEITVGLHRLFSHRAFKTSPFWQHVFLWGCVPFGFGSPIQWAAIHYLHHKHSDTDLDPHKNGGVLRALIHRRYVMPPMDRLPAPSARLVSDRWHMLVHRNYVGLWLFLLGAGLLLAPDFTINGFLPGLGLLHFMSSLHEYATHKAAHQGTRNLPFLEIVLPFAGEWYHENHHKRPGEVRFGRIDLGAFIINLIQRSPV